MQSTTLRRIAGQRSWSSKGGDRAPPSSGRWPPSSPRPDRGDPDARYLPETVTPQADVELVAAQIGRVAEVEVPLPPTDRRPPEPTEPAPRPISIRRRARSSRSPRSSSRPSSRSRARSTSSTGSSRRPSSRSRPRGRSGRRPRPRRARRRRRPKPSYWRSGARSPSGRGSSADDELPRPAERSRGRDRARRGRRRVRWPRRPASLPPPALLAPDVELTPIQRRPWPRRSATSASSAGRYWPRTSTEPAPRVEAATLSPAADRRAASSRDARSASPGLVDDAGRG